jgi:hypothetical protein
MHVIESDASRPAAVAAVRDLLTGDGERHPTPILRDLVPGNDPAVIVAPEFAFGSSDWSSIDTLVRQSTQPVVLLAGFGAAPASKILAWAGHQELGATSRKLGWDEIARPVAPNRPVNGAWCWIHGFNGENTCLVFLKNVVEQTVEAVHLPDLQLGRMVTRLSFADCEVFPLICADLIRAVTKADSPLARIRAVLESLDQTAKPVLVTGSLYQGAYNVNWETAIDNVLNTVAGARPVALALCNVAADAVCEDDSYDQWRNFTGVYGRFSDLPKNQPSLPVGRPVGARGIVGAVVRKTNPCLAAGAVSWPPYGPVTSRFIWHAQLTCEIVNQGLSAPSNDEAIVVAGEVRRFLRRHPPLGTWSPRVTQGRDRLVTHIGAGDKPTPVRILCTLLNGVGPAPCADPDRLNSEPIRTALQAALNGLALLVAAEDLEWQGDSQLDGQLRLKASDTHLLIWRDPVRSGRQITRDLGAWRSRPGKHPKLVVIAAGPHDSPEEGLIRGDRRDDISLSPAPSADIGISGNSLAAAPSDITEPRMRRVACLRFDRLAATYMDYVAAEDAERLEEMMQQIIGVFPHPVVE